MSGPDPKSRLRVERLLRGDVRPGDLTDLFLYARDRCDGRETVAEVGHFVAHQNERHKGITTRSTRIWFALVKYFVGLMAKEGRNVLNIEALPSSAREYFRAADLLIRASDIKLHTGLSRAKARVLLHSLADRLTKNSDGTWALPAGCTYQELNLVTCVSSYLVTKTAFEPARLVEEFIATLKSNGLISKEEIRAHLQRLEQLIPLYAISVMHNSLIQLGDGETCWLKGSAKTETAEIEIIAVIPPVVTSFGLVARLASTMFFAELSPAVHCHPDLLGGHFWDCEVELGPDGRLAPMR